MTAATEGRGAMNDYAAGITSSGNVVDADGIDADTLAYSWQSGNETDGWMEISMLSRLHTELDDVHVRAGFLRLCVFYTDDAGNAEGGDATSAATRVANALLCSAPIPVANVNDAPVADNSTVIVFTTASSTAPRPLAAADFAFTDDDRDGLESVTIVSLPTVGTLTANNVALTAVPASAITLAQLNSGYLGYYPDANASASATYATLTFNVTDDGDDGSSNTASTMAATLTIDLQPPSQLPADGSPAAGPIAGAIYEEDIQLTADTGTVRDPNGIDGDSLQWQWQQAAASDGSFTDIAAATGVNFTPLQAHVGQWLRVCLSFTDEYDEQDSSATAGNEGPLCSTPIRVHNVNDAPTSTDAAVSVFSTANAAAPYRFKVADFPFTDEDAGQPSGGTLESVTIVSLPTAAGTFRFRDAAVTVNTPVPVAELDNLSWHPPDDTTVQDNYATFTFSVSDGALSSTQNYTMTINIVPPEQTAASGEPVISGTLEQNAPLTADRGTVTDPNGINEMSIGWQWQISATASGTFTAIDGATDSEFTPGQPQVGQYLQVCMSFRDTFVNLESGNPQPADERRCSTHYGPIANVNDKPVAASRTHQAERAADSPTVTIPASAFIAAYTDIDDNDPLSAVTITETPDAAHGTLSFNGTAVAAGQTPDGGQWRIHGRQLDFHHSRQRRESAADLLQIHPARQQQCRQQRGHPDSSLRQGHHRTAGHTAQRHPRRSRDRQRRQRHHRSHDRSPHRL